MSTTIVTPTGEATMTIEVNPITGEPIEGITEDEWLTLIDTLNQIKINTTATPIDPTSNPSGMALTYEQGQVILEKMELFQDMAVTVILVVFVVFIMRWLYRFIGGFLFGGL